MRKLTTGSPRTTDGDGGDQSRLAIEHVDPRSLKHHPTNTRNHNSQNIDAIKASYTTFGQRKPLVVWRGLVIAGNGALEAVLALGWKSVAITRCDHLTDAEARTYSIADNKTTDLSTFNYGKLAVELKELNAGGVALESTGFQQFEIEPLLNMADASGMPEEEVIPEPPTTPKSKRGELYLLGTHRLLCGDATSESDVRHACGSLRPFIMVTDPPYGVNYDPNWRNVAAAIPGSKVLYGARRIAPVKNDDRADWSDVYKYFTGDVIYVWHAGLFAAEIERGLRSAEFIVRNQIIWCKQYFVLSRGAYHWKHEPCWYAVRDGSKAKWCGDHSQSTVWEINNSNPTGGTKSDISIEHSTQKPLECMARPIRNHGDKNDVVYDPFVGTGTTLIAAETLGRACVAIELEPKWIDVTIQRWENLTKSHAKKI